MVPQNHHFLPKKASNFACDVCPLYENVTVQYNEVPPRAGTRLLSKCKNPPTCFDDLADIDADFEMTQKL